MLMSMVYVRVVRVTVKHLRMPVRVAMGDSRRLSLSVLVLMMFIMDMPVLVFKWRVRVRVLVSLS